MATFSCRDHQGILVTDTDSVLRIWKEHFSKLLVSNSSDVSDETSYPITEDGIECILPGQDKVKTVINRLKNNKTVRAGCLLAELFTSR